MTSIIIVLTVSSKEDAPRILYHPTICNNQHLLRLSYLMRMIEVFRIAKSVRYRLCHEEKITQKKENSQKGWILEVYLEYPKELREEHNSYPLSLEKKVKRS